MAGRWCFGLGYGWKVVAGSLVLRAESVGGREDEGLLELNRLFQHESSKCIYRGNGVEKRDVYALE